MKTIQSPIIITSIRSRKDGSLGFSAETPEYTVEEKVAFMTLQNQNVLATLKPTDYKEEEELIVDKDVENKTQAQRIRSVLFLIWKQEGEQGEFSDYYKNKTEKYINYLKDKLD